MIQTINNLNCETVLTADGSPSLISWREGEKKEAMHNLKGAWSESLYVYENALLEVLPRLEIPKVLSVGLGLGYNEIISTGLCLKRGKRISLHSFEKEPVLREAFRAWLTSENKNFLFPIYDQIERLACNHYKLEPGQIRTALFNAFKSENFQLHGELKKDQIFPQNFNVIFYDAFSQNKDPELWTEAFISQFLKQSAGSLCSLSTYAATGPLKRALKASGFHVKARPGYGGKRHSTYALKGPHT